MSTAAAIIAFAVLVLVAMAGVAGYVLGRARAAEATTKKTLEADERLHGTLVYCRDRIITVSGLLAFETEQTERYRNVARKAVEALPSKDIRKLLLERELQKADNVLQAKIAEVKEVTKKG